MRLFFKKLFNKNTLKIIVCVCCVMFLVFTPNFIFNKQNYSRNINKYLSNNKGEQVVLNVWHVETFEGGIKSRRKFLEEIGMKYNKNNPNIFVSVVSLTEEQLYLNLENNSNFDLISFGVGSGNEIGSILQPLKNNNKIINSLIDYSTINKQILAYPYMLSGYVAVSKNCDETLKLEEKLNSKTSKNVLGFGFATESYINPSQVLVENDIKQLSNNNFCNCTTSYDAYQKFISNKFQTLVGTLRDYYRCKNREELGKLQGCSYEFLGGYTDLIQYIGMSKFMENNKKEVAEDFINYLLDENSQKALKNYGLFSSTCCNIYNDSFLHNAEKRFFSGIKSVNVFSSKEEIENKNKQSFEKLFGH